MSQRISHIIKAVVFTAIGVAILAVCNFIAQPFWTVSNNTLNGFYEEPENTIETVFVGASHMFCAVSPAELYENYGICAYDLSVNSQPMSASYYWIREAYKYHSETLDTVMLNISILKKDPSTAGYHQSFDLMRFSMDKVYGVKSYSEDFTDFLMKMFPLLSYHDRWKELTSSDFTKYRDEPQLYLRGFGYSTSSWISSADSFSDISTPLLILDDEAENATLNEKSLKYFKEIVSFCEENDLRLVLVNMPAQWSSADYNAVKELADEYGLDYLDFNVEPYYSDINFNFATDERNPSDITNLHLNYYGATKLTDYMGQYLVDVCGNKDVRGDEKYAFMDEELDDYRRYIADTTVTRYADPCDYVEYALEEGDYTIFISVKDDASAALTEEQRDYFASVGLTQLAELTYQSSYLAVIEDGVIVTEMTEKNPGSDNATGETISYEGILPDGTEYVIESGGRYLGNKANITIAGTQRASNSRGLNIVLYDNRQEKYVTRAVFDTSTSSERTIQNIEQRLEADLEAGMTLAEMSGTERELYLYNRLCENEKTVKTLQNMDRGGLYQYLTAFWDDEDINIYITVQNDATSALTQDLRTSLNELNLTKLSEIEYQDSYFAVISGGEVVFEESSHDGDALELCTSKYILRSAGSESGGNSSIMIDGKEYTDGKDGIQIIIYDNITDSVVYSGSFATVPENVSEEVA